jgi:serine protease Do
MMFRISLLALLFFSHAFIYGSVDSQISNLKAQANAFSHVAAKGQPAVVSISTVKRSSQRLYGYDFFGMPREYYNQEERPGGIGSGVIVSSDGYILTNYHVIENATEMIVTLSDGREFEAKVIGSDEKTDLALLKVDQKNLPIIPLGDSDDIQVGEWAIAIGNPFGLSGTVTVGIISAVGRADLEGDIYSDFIQTDAAINPGNSGGALLNIDGELIGINSAIYTQSGGYMGVGFAIPVNMATRIMEDLKRNGRVIRGSLGVVIEPIRDDIMKRFNLTSKRGAFVRRVVDGSSAEKAGLREGDIILQYDGKDVSNFKSLRSKVTETPIGKKIAILYLRDGKRKRTHVTLTPIETVSKALDTDPFGLSLMELDEDLRKRYRIRSRRGLLVADVLANSKAYQRFITPGDIVTAINGKPVDTIQEYQEALSHGSMFEFSVQRGSYKRRIILRK